MTWWKVCDTEIIPVVGGGARGGKRSNAGKKAESNPFTDWKQYKPIGKKESAKIAKSNKTITQFFGTSNKSKGNEDVIETLEMVNSSNKEEDCEEYDIDWIKVVKKSMTTYAGKKLQYFKNGCFAADCEKLGSGSNYTCAIDTLLSLGEAILLSSNFKSIQKILDFSPLLQEVKKVLLFRLENNFFWNHNLRNDVWTLMARSFPVTITPIGRVTASIDEAVQELGKLWPIQVIIEVVCSESECGKDLGKFSCIFDYVLLLSRPQNGPLADENYSLCDLIVDRIKSHVKKMVCRKIRCESCRGLPKLVEVNSSDIKIP